MFKTTKQLKQYTKKFPNSKNLFSINFCSQNQNIKHEYKPVYLNQQSKSNSILDKDILEQLKQINKLKDELNDPDNIYKNLEKIKVDPEQYNNFPHLQKGQTEINLKQEKNYKNLFLNEFGIANRGDPLYNKKYILFQGNFVDDNEVVVDVENFNIKEYDMLNDKASSVEKDGRRFIKQQLEGNEVYTPIDDETYNFLQNEIQIERLTKSINQNKKELQNMD
ncbi:hypothetical protein PPERSA_08507 [Pseudocohnilembus persalinus]|uniref:Uncharacterized protein n=1 Tax=Pseudocohnilembus persalinus TaxID=266149 RepID=A0A0V0R7H1_PSEPJ|nr:hypothetical protein PPERSA_08507 [Pseudocohnilembus persalinus]|eukprot:KRX10104.1 hypothetical protein PPERSA_08507 [Pseudocohnilembus persalinus]